MPAPKVLVIGYDPDVGRMFLKNGWQFCAANEEPDLVVFTGGEDVNPSLYNEELHHTTFFNKERDETEMKVFNKYEQYPKVGICRGGQLLNVLSGGEMWQNVNGHGIYGLHTMVDLLTGDSVEVTSTHHQMMIAGKDAEVLAIAWESSSYQAAAPNKDRATPDFDTEVVWYRSTNSLCFQPHPEYDYAPEELVDYFFSLIEMFWNLSGKTAKEAA